MQKWLCLEGTHEPNLRGGQGKSVMGGWQHWLCWVGGAVCLAKTQVEICPIDVSNGSEKWEKSKRGQVNLGRFTSPMKVNFFVLGEDGRLGASAGQAGKGLLGWRDQLDGAMSEQHLGITEK